MRCYYLFVHGELDWIDATIDGDAFQPAGFCCFRWVLAIDETRAAEKAFARVRANLDSRTRWLSNGAAALRLEAGEVRPAPFYKLLKPDNRGHSFYRDRDNDALESDGPPFSRLNRHSAPECESGEI